MAVALGLRVTAEGVETQLQLDLLRDLGCHCAQGFGIGVPVAAPELERLVRRGRRRADTGELPLLQLDPEAAAASQPTS
jgi:EAL domain-containing protein (putative c-di-GMP-specific phosphodiesterase class I)